MPPEADVPCRTRAKPPEPQLLPFSSYIPLSTIRRYAAHDAKTYTRRFITVICCLSIFACIEINASFIDGFIWERLEPITQLSRFKSKTVKGILRSELESYTKSAAINLHGLTKSWGGRVSRQRSSDEWFHSFMIPPARYHRADDEGRLGRKSLSFIRATPCSVTGLSP